MENKFTTKKIFKNDCYLISNIHMKSFPNSSLTKLGKEAVNRYYKSQMSNKNDWVSVGTYKDDILLGFILAGIFENILNDFLYENRFYLIKRIMTNPILIIEPDFRDAIKLALKKLMKINKRQKKVLTTQKKIKNFVILSIGVLPEFQNLGIGKLLMDSVEELAREKKFEKIYLTVNSDNFSAINFYKKIGWSATGVRDRKSIEMVKKIL